LNKITIYYFYTVQFSIKILDFKSFMFTILLPIVIFMACSPLFLKLVMS